MVVVGIPKLEENHAELAAEMALDMLLGLRNVNLPFLDNPITVKIGVHSGSIVAGVMGWKVPRYGVFGDTVNIVNFLEKTSKPSRIHISKDTFEILVKTDKYIMKARRRNSIQNKDELCQRLRDQISDTFWLCGRGTSFITAADNDVSPPKIPEVMTEKKEESSNKRCWILNEDIEAYAPSVRVSGGIRERMELCKKSLLDVDASKMCIVS